MRKDARREFQWRIRNLPYPLETYELSVEERTIVLRTTNKKYFKRFGVADLDRLALPIDGSGLSMAHANNTLIITLPKPAEFLAFEKQLFAMRDQLKGAADGDVDCATQ